MTVRYGIAVFIMLTVSSFEVRADGHDLDWNQLLSEPDVGVLMRLAHRYEKGARRDYGRARQLYCAAARLGHAPAQVRLAWMYAYGVGAPQDTELAGAWLRVAAAKGDLHARRFLALLEYPPRGRQPRCTYSSRYDQYAIATIPTSVNKRRSAVDEEAQTSLSEEIGIVNSSLDEASRRQIEDWVRRLAPRYGLEPELVLAMISVESNFNPRAISPKNAWGLMQLIPDTAARFGVRDSFNPVQNLHGGMAYMRWLLAYFAGDLRLALAGYNAGEGAVEKYLGIPPYPETRNYVRKVIKRYGRTTHPKVEQVVPPSRAVTRSPATRQPG